MPDRFGEFDFPELLPILLDQRAFPWARAMARMTFKPSEPSDDKEAERRFNETLGRMLNTPHQPHVKKPESDSGRPGEKRGRPKTAPKSQQ